MDAVEFTKTCARICREYGDCANCILSDFCDHSCYEYDNYQVAEQAVANVLEWAKEHPVKTRQSELLKLFPNVNTFPNGALNICPYKIEPEKYANAAIDRPGCIYIDDSKYGCDQCCRDFWLKEIK